MRSRTKGFYRRSILHIQCGGAIEVENCRAVLECTEDQVRLQMARWEVVLMGRKLQLESLNRRTLVLRGCISESAQQAKGEGRWMAGLFAAVQFTARGGRVGTPLLDWCVAQRSPGAANLPGMRRAYCLASGPLLPKAASPGAAVWGVQIRVNRKRGLWFFLARGVRAGALAGPLASLLVLHLAGGIIRSVQYNVPGPMLKKQLEAQLFSQNLQPGAAPTQADLQAAEQALLKQCPELGWITPNFADGRLTVEWDRSRDRRSSRRGKA